MGRCYRGRREADGTAAVFVEEADGFRPLPHVMRHSPTGFEWGYGGSGPADLALSILADALGSEEAALPLYQAFKWDVVAALDHAGWRLPVEQVLEWVRARGPLPGPNRDRKRDRSVTDRKLVAGGKERWERP